MLYFKSYEMFKAKKNYGVDDTLTKQVTDLFNNVLNISIQNVIGNKVNLVVKHATENSFSPSDIAKFIDLLKVEGLNVRLAFIDYIDVTQPSITTHTNFNDYDAQGTIVHEFRNLARIKKIPIISATQNRRDSENVNMTLNNSMIGDSIKKVRYTDFLYMCRMDTTKNIFNDHNLLKTCPPDLVNYAPDGTPTYSPKLLKMKDQLIDNLIPFEVKITKSKDSRKEKKDVAKYALFCAQNLRIYNDVNEYLTDLPLMIKKSNILKQDIITLSNGTISNVVSEYDDDLSFNL